MKISHKLQISNLNINKDILFSKISDKLSENDNSILHLKKLIKEGNLKNNKNNNKENIDLNTNLKGNRIGNINLNSQENLQEKNREFLLSENSEENHQNPQNHYQTNKKNYNEIHNENYNEKHNENPIHKKLEKKENHLIVHVNKHQINNKKEIINRKVSLSNLIQWAKSNKIQLRKIHLNFLSNGYDIAKVAEKINKNSLIFNIPKEFLILPNMPLVREECEKIRKIPEFTEETDFICLAAALRKLRNDKRFKDYITYLYDSVKFSNFPIFYNKSEMILMKGSYLESLINARKSLYKLEYNLIKNKKIFDLDYTEEDYFKSRIIINSKFFDLKINNKITPVLIPLSDIFYSKSLKSNVELVQINGAIQLKTIEYINKKNGIELSVGKASNYQYLINYGFSKINNPSPLEIYLDLKIKNANGEKKNKEILLSKDFNINNALITLRKTVNKLTNEKIKIKNKNFDNPKSIENEYESLRVFKGGLKSQIFNYSTKLNQDINKLSKTKNHNEINLLNILIEEKKVNYLYYYY
jgi:hypothetical protein